MAAFERRSHRTASWWRAQRAGLGFSISITTACSTFSLSPVLRVRDALCIGIMGKADSKMFPGEPGL